MNKRFNPGRPETAYKSSDKVKCGLCEDWMRYDTLKRHFKRKHGSINAFVHVEGESANKKQRTVESFFNNTTPTG